MKRQKKAGKAQLQALFSPKRQEKGRNNSTNLTLLMLGFPKKMLKKLMILAFSSPLRVDSACAK